MVWNAASVLKIPIIGMGGICTARDAIEFFLAGATAVAVGSMTFRQPDAALRVVDGIANPKTDAPRIVIQNSLVL